MMERLWFYEASTAKYVVKPVSVDSNNITNIQGGTFLNKEKKWQIQSFN
jgi:hypothetical protein